MMKQSLDDVVKQQLKLMQSRHGNIPRHTLMDLAQDVAMDMLLLAEEQLPTVEDMHRWCYVALKRKCINYLRNTKRRQTFTFDNDFEQTFRTIGETPASPPDGRELLDSIRRHLRSLPQAQNDKPSSSLMAAAYENRDVSLEEMSRFYGLTMKYLRKRIRRGQDRIRKLMWELCGIENFNGFRKL